MNFVEVCRQFISIDSSKSQGTVELVDFASRHCLENQFSVEVQDEALHGRQEKNLIVRFNDEVVPNELLLQTHLDTADPGILSMWTKTASNPFNGSIYGDLLYGLGSADAKLDFLCKLEAMKQLRDEGFCFPVVLVGTFDGTSGMSGAVKLIRRGKIKASHALVGHPTDLSVVNASFGLAVVEITIPFSDEEKEYHKRHDLMLSSSCQSKMFYGEPGHSTQTLFKENAIINMMEFLSQLPKGIAVMDMEGGSSFNAVPESAVLEFDLMGGFTGKTVASKVSKILKSVKAVETEFLDFPCEGFSPNIPTLNIGTVEKKGDHLRFTGSCRLTPNITNAQYEGWMKQLNQSCDEVGATFQIVDYKSAFKTKKKSGFLKAAQKSIEEIMGEPIPLKKISECTEASVFHRLGVECLVFGAGKHEGNSYEPNEHVNLEKLNKSIEFYKNLIQLHFASRED